MHNYLLSYRTTPHATTGISPAKLIFQHNIKDKLPALPEHPQLDKNLQKVDKNKKSKMKQYADKTRKATPHTFSQGDHVIVSVTKKHRNKTESFWNPIPGHVTNVKGNSILIKQGPKTIMRNSSQVKHYTTSKFHAFKHHTDVRPISSETDSDDDLFIARRLDNHLQTSSDSDRTIAYEDSSDNSDAETVVETDNEGSNKIGRPVRNRNPPASLKDFIVEK